MRDVFDPDDFRAVRLYSDQGEVFYFGSPTEEIRVKMSQNANLTLAHLVGVAKRFTKEEWVEVWQEMQEWGKQFEEAEDE